MSVEGAAKSLQVRWPGPDDVKYALAGITPEGKLKTRHVNWKADDIGVTDLAHEYLAKVASLVWDMCGVLRIRGAGMFRAQKVNFPKPSSSCRGKTSGSTSSAGTRAS